MKYFATTREPGFGLNSYTFETDGSMPSVPAYENVWDATMLYGCLCDEGFYGFDCSLRMCPSGDGGGASRTAGPLVALEVGYSLTRDAHVSAVGEGIVCVATRDFEVGESLFP